MSFFGYSRCLCWHPAPVPTRTAWELSTEGVQPVGYPSLSTTYSRAGSPRQSGATHVLTTAFTGGCAPKTPDKPPVARGTAPQVLSRTAESDPLTGTSAGTRSPPPVCPSVRPSVGRRAAWPSPARRGRAPLVEAPPPCRSPAGAFRVLPPQPTPKLFPRGGGGCESEPPAPPGGPPAAQTPPRGGESHRGVGR